LQFTGQFAALVNSVHGRGIAHERLCPQPLICPNPKSAVRKWALKSASGSTVSSRGSPRNGCQLVVNRQCLIRRKSVLETRIGLLSPVDFEFGCCSRIELSETNPLHVLVAVWRSCPGTIRLCVMKSKADRLEHLRSLVIPYAALPWVQRKRPGVPGRRRRILRPMPMLQLPTRSLQDRTERSRRAST
jgi:hypothetical protein